MSDQTKSKSVLDNVPVVDKVFPLCAQSQNQTISPNDDQLYVVGSCPRCGSPIYGTHTVKRDALPETKYSCNCRLQNTFHK